MFQSIVKITSDEKIIINQFKSLVFLIISNKVINVIKYSEFISKLNFNISYLLSIFILDNKKLIYGNTGINKSNW